MTTPARGRPRGRKARQSRQSRQAAPASGLAEPPWSRVQRVQLIRREVREVLSPGAIQVLFDHAEVMVEGDEELGGRRVGDRRIYATVMVTFDLDRCASFFREPADEATARRVAELLEAEPEAQARLRALAVRELAHLAGADPDALSMVTEIGVRVEGTAVLVDIDAMATLAGLRG